MTDVNLKGLHTVRAKSGKVYYYAWRGGPALPGEPGSEKFLKAYIKFTRATPDEKKIDGLVAAYKGSDAFLGLADSTRKNWGPWLDHIRDGLGKLNIKAFNQPEVRQIIKKWRDKWKDTPRTADTGKQVLSAVLSYAVEEGMIGTNPCFGISNLYSNDRSDIIWTAEDLASFLGKCSTEIEWALRLACLTGLRQGDLLALQWSHIDHLAIDMNTSKSRGRRIAVVPLYDELRALLAEIPKRAITVLTNQDGEPWGKGFGSSWNKAALRAAFPKEVHDQARKEKRRLKLEDAPDWKLHFHDARGTAATKFYLAGFTPEEIAEILAWEKDRVERILNRYVRRDALIRAKIERLNRAGVGGGENNH